MAAILALMDHTGTPPQKVVISHTIRLIILIMLAGVVVGSDHPVPPPADIPPQSLVSVLWLLVIVVCGYLSGKALEKSMSRTVYADITGHGDCGTEHGEYLHCFPAAAE